MMANYKKERIHSKSLGTCVSIQIKIMNSMLAFRYQMLWLAYVVLFGILVSCSKQDEQIDPFAFPDFILCKCSSVYKPVCGEDGRNYLNSCFTDCKNVKVQSDSLCPIQNFVARDTMTWPIVSVCIPVQHIDSPIEVKYFSDFTVLYQNKDGSYFRGTQNLCRCLPSDALISTPNGEIKISHLQEGEPVFTVDDFGVKQIAPILTMINVPVGPNHLIANVQLENGKILKCSPMHPDAQGRQIGSLHSGDCLDGQTICNVTIIPFDRTSTWDILPSGETGYYFVNGILVGSTLRNSKKLSQ